MNTSNALLFIALERLCCILCPLQMNNMSRFWVKVHLFVITAVGVGYGLYQNVAIYVGILQQLQGKEVLCFNDYQVAWVSNIQYKVNMSLFALTVALYALIWALMIHAAIQKRKVVSGHNMNILRSLNVLMLIIIFGWLLNGALPLYLPLLALSREQSYTFINVLTTISAFASATNAPVLYMFSGEYKRNFQQTFQWLPKTQANSSSNVANGISSRTVAAAAANTVRPAPIHQRFS